MIDLGAIKSVQSNLFIEINATRYRTTPTGEFSSTTLRFSDRQGSYNLLGTTYTGIGQLLGVTQSSSEIRVSGDEVSISISGIPNSSIQEILYSDLKGSYVTIKRAFFNASTGVLINAAGNPTTRFLGMVNKISLSEEYDNDARSSSNTLTITCSSAVDILSNKIAGRKTNPISHKKYFASDLSMDRVPNLENSYFNFGAKL